ncbi:MAG: hypothetical protein EXR89_05335 [Methylococcaceae bacterium]|nr:hypothetical protein [Methylococcaceae bacterium]
MIVSLRENAVYWENEHPRNMAFSDFNDGIGMMDGRDGLPFGAVLASRKFITQESEVHARIAAMNTMTYLGMPISVRIGVNMP